MEMFSRQDHTQNDGIKMADLAQLSGVSKSAIHLYLNMGLLHPARKLGLNLSVYDWTHLDRLKRIRDLRENRRLSLGKIKEILSTESRSQSSISSEHDIASLISTLREEKKMNKARKTQAKKIEIMDAAISLFSKNGYEKTTIDAIADSLHMAKSTVYLYFETKEDLFMECIERLTVVVVPEESWDEIRKEHNALTKLKKRGTAFHKAFPSYKGILTMTKAALGGDNIKLAEKAKNTLSLMTRPVAEDLRKGMADGIFRRIDEEIVAHGILAMGEGLGCRLMMDTHYTIEKAVEIMFDVLTNGILKRGPAEASKLEPDPGSGKVTDLKGLVTSVRSIRFANATFLPAKIGEAEVRIFPQKVKELGFLHQGPSLYVEIKDSNGQTGRAEVDGSMILSGEVAVGDFKIELNNVTSVFFEAIEPRNSATTIVGEKLEDGI
jgi:AcrR family transcriptional regulator